MTLAKLVPEVVVTSKSPGVLPVSVVRYVQPLPSVMYDSPVAPVAPIAPVAPEPDPEPSGLIPIRDPVVSVILIYIGKASETGLVAVR